MQNLCAAAVVYYMCRYIYIACCCLLFVCLPAACCWKRRRAVHCNLNLSDGPFIMDISRAGSSIVLFVLIALTPVCQFHPLAASLLLLFALAGAHKSVIFAGENSELNSCIPFVADESRSKQLLHVMLPKIHILNDLIRKL